MDNKAMVFVELWLPILFFVVLLIYMLIYHLIFYFPQETRQFFNRIQKALYAKLGIPTVTPVEQFEMQQI
uniref:Uncharacterized protein n=1 Tax=Steinernema glaseri TaxID=37863 RepID=A0A1I7YG07_9BILA